MFCVCGCQRRFRIQNTDKSQDTLDQDETMMENMDRKYIFVFLQYYKKKLFIRRYVDTKIERFNFSCNTRDKTFTPNHLTSISKRLNQRKGHM